LAYFVLIDSESAMIKSIVPAMLFTLSACQTMSPERPTPVPPQKNLTSPEASARATQLFDEIASKYPALNVTVRRRGRIVWEHEGGRYRQPHDGVSTKYNFYSTAKMLTGLAFARLEQEQGLDLSQSVRAIDPNLPPHYALVTLRHLLTHAGGVRHYSGDADWSAFNSRRCATPAEAIGHFINDPLAAVPGERLGYSSYGFVLLSHLLVKVTGSPTYDEAMRDVLGSAYRMQTDREGARKATSYVEENGAFKELPNLSAECKFGAGGLLASARDLALFGEALYSGAIVDLERAPQLFIAGQTGGKPNPFAYGSVVRVENGAHVVGHSGGSPGGRSYLEVWLEPQVSIAVTGNFEGPGLGELTAGLARIFAEGS
jgi:serine beta-lactamase-like protein LACTB